MSSLRQTTNLQTKGQENEKQSAMSSMRHRKDLRRHETHERKVRYSFHI